MADKREATATDVRLLIAAACASFHLTSGKEYGMSAIATKGQLSTDGIWRVDPAHSSIEFRVRHMVIETVKGRFLDFDGVVVPGEVPRIAGSIRVASLDTNHTERDDHLRSSDFFDANRYPEMAFESSSVELSDDGRLVVVGLLKIKRITRPIQLIGDVPRPRGRSRRA